MEWISLNPGEWRGTIVPTKRPIQNLRMAAIYAYDPKEISRSQRDRSRDDFSFGFEGLKNRNAYTEQEFTHMDPTEIDLGLRKVLNFPPEQTWSGKFIDVPAAYIGKFASRLKQIGFDTRVSDIDLYWLNFIRSQGIHAEYLSMDDLPERPDKFATICFEPIPLFESLSGGLTLLKETVASEKGMINVESNHSGDGHLFVDDLYNIGQTLRKGKLPSNLLGVFMNPEMHAYYIIHYIYGLPIRIVDTANLRYCAFDNISAEIRTVIRQDLNIVPFLQQLVLNGDNKRSSEFSPIEAGKITGLSPQQLIDSLTRLSELMYFCQIDLKDTHPDKNKLHELYPVPKKSEDKQFWL